MKLAFANFIGEYPALMPIDTSMFVFTLIALWNGNGEQIIPS